MQFLNIYTHKERLTIEINQQLIQGTLQTLKNYVISILGFTNQLYLYREPLSTFNSLHFVKKSAKFKDILVQFGQICLTYNNRQNSEEPDFLSPLPKSSNHIILIVQTCLQNIFSYERYKIDSKTPISFVKGIVLRSATVDKIFVQYYGLRISITEFGNEQTIAATISKLEYANQSILLTADDQTNNQLFMEVKNNDLVNFEDYYLIFIDEEKQIVMNRQADVQTVHYLLTIILKSACRIKQVEKTSNQKLQINKYVNKVTVSQQTLSSLLVPPLQNSFFVGQTSSYLIFLQQSSILHVYSRFHPFQLINSTVLYSQPCRYLQEDIPILLNEQLIMYNITISCMILKYYDLPRCQMRQTKHYKWEKEYGLVKADTLDLIAVNYKQNLIKVFYVYNPKVQFEIKKPQIDWYIFVAKSGYNVLSNGSGLFGIGGSKTSILEVYSMIEMQKITTIKLNISPSSIISLSFDGKRKRILITNQDECELYDFQAEEMTLLKKQAKKEVYCFSPNGSIFKATPSTFQWLQSVQMRVKSSVALCEGAALSFNADLQAGNFTQIHELKMNE